MGGYCGYVILQMDEVVPLIVGVCLASDADPAHSHTLSTITLPPSLLSHPLAELRPLIASAFPLPLYGRPFIFLTHHGWEVPAALEPEARIEQVKCVYSLAASVF